MSVDSRAGMLPVESDLVDVDRLLAAYFERSEAPGRVVFGTSGHRGSLLGGSFTEAHVAAIGEAVCRYRQWRGIDGPLFLGRATRALSGPACETIVEVLVGHGVEVCVDVGDGATPTPVRLERILGEAKLIVDRALGR
jgi:phosphoglucomutase